MDEQLIRDVALEVRRRQGFPLRPDPTHPLDTTYTFQVVKLVLQVLAERERAEAAAIDIGG